MTVAQPLGRDVDILIFCACSSEISRGVLIPFDFFRCTLARRVILQVFARWAVQLIVISSDCLDFEAGFKIHL